jgi:hypothetical protein
MRTPIGESTISQQILSRLIGVFNAMQVHG